MKYLDIVYKSKLIQHICIGLKLFVKFINDLRLTFYIEYNTYNYLAGGYIRSVAPTPKNIIKHFEQFNGVVYNFESALSDNYGYNFYHNCFYRI